MSFFMLHGLGDCSPVHHCGCSPDYQRRERVIFTPIAGPTRKALILSKVSGLDAYEVRMTDGSRATVAGSQLRPSKSAR